MDQRQNVVCQVTPELLAPAAIAAATSSGSSATVGGSRTKSETQKQRWHLLHHRCTSWEVVIPVTFVLYLLFCAAMITSPYLQSTLVYLHHVRIPMGDLTDLQRFGLLNARNIEVVTEDGVQLKGYHLLPPTVVGQQSYRRMIERTRAQQQQLQQLQSTGGSSSSNSSNNHSSTSSRGSDYVVGVSTQHASTATAALWEEFFDEQLYGGHHLQLESAESPAQRVIIYLHGNGATRALPNRVEMIKSMAAQFDAHVVAVDYRGFADSGAVVRRDWAERMGHTPHTSSYASPSEEATYLDALAVLMWVLDKTGKCRTSDGRTSSVNRGGSGMRGPAIYVYGHSLGTGVGVDLLYRLTKAQDHGLDDGAPLYQLSNSCTSYANLKALYHEKLGENNSSSSSSSSSNSAVSSSNSEIKRQGQQGQGQGQQVEQEGSTVAGAGKSGKRGLFGSLLGGKKVAPSTTAGTTPAATSPSASKSTSAGAPLAAIPLVNGLMLDSGFSSLPVAAMDHPLGAVFRVFPAVKELIHYHLAFRYDSISKINTVTDANVPVMLLHSMHDDKVPYRHSVALYDHIYLNPSRKHYKDRNDEDGGDCDATCLSSGGSGGGAVNTLAEKWYHRCYFNERSRCIHHHQHHYAHVSTEQPTADAEPAVDGGNGYDAVYCENHCPVRLVQILYSDHNKVHYSKLWSHHMYDFMEYVEDGQTRKEMQGRD